MWAVGLRVLSAGYAEAPLCPRAWTPASVFRGEAAFPSPLHLFTSDTEAVPSSSFIRYLLPYSTSLFSISLLRESILSLPCHKTKKLARVGVALLFLPAPHRTAVSKGSMLGLPFQGEGQD